MPIANVVTMEAAADLDAEAVLDIWSAEAGVSSEQMTINVIRATRQAGARFAAMAFLYLPSLWDAQQVRSLQLGLATALARCSRLPAEEIQVVTSIVESGHAVEKGEVQDW